VKTPNDTPWRIIGWLAPVAIAILLITTSVRFAANSLPLYDALFERHSVVERTGISADDLSTVSSQIQAYFNSDLGPLHVAATAGGIKRDLFTDAEISHMADVKNLFRGTYRVQSLSVAFLAILCLAAVWRFHGVAIIVAASWMRRGAIATGLTILVFGLLSLFAFDLAFTAFHYVGFPQGNWQFDSQSHYLVRIFPFGFWRDITLVIGILTVIQAAAIWGISAALSLRLRSIAR
jgi:integral membrane protein (TIGR01906 family)